MATNMTFTDFVTPVPADWLNNVNTWVNFLSSRQLVNAGNASGQSIPTGTATLVTNWTNTVNKNPGPWNSTTGVFTTATTGIYRLQVALLLAPASVTAGNSFTAAWLLNGSGILTQGQFIAASTNAVRPTIFLDVVASLTAGQTVGVYVNQSSGSAVPLDTGGGFGVTNNLSIEQLF